MSVAAERRGEDDDAPDLTADLEAMSSEPPDARALAARLGGLVTAKLDHLVPEEILREMWTTAHAPVVALLPEVAAGLLAAGRPR